MDGAVSPSASSAAPSVVIAARERPDRATQVRLAEWEGPLGLLLALVEARRLDVLTVPLAGLAEAYLDALAGLAGDRLGSVSAFVAVASQLILIKSRALLPRAPDVAAVALDGEPDPEADLRTRLLLYRAYRDAGAALAARAEAGLRLLRREPSVAQEAARAGSVRPDLPRLDPTELAAAIEELIAIVPPPPVPPEVIPRSITLDERAAAIRAALAVAGPIVLQELLRGVRDRVVVAVTFLAMLELVKRREVAVEQAEPWGPIIVRAVPSGGRSGDPGEGA